MRIVFVWENISVRLKLPWAWVNKSLSVWFCVMWCDAMASFWQLVHGRPCWLFGTAWECCHAGWLGNVVPLTYLWQAGVDCHRSAWLFISLTAVSYLIPPPPLRITARMYSHTHTRAMQSLAGSCHYLLVITYRAVEHLCEPPLFLF